MSSALNYKTVSFTAAATSGTFDLGNETVIGLRVPASFGQTSITFQETADGTNFNDVMNYTGAAVTVTVNSSTAQTYDLTDIFPVCIRKGKLKTGGTITKDVVIITKGV